MPKVFLLFASALFLAWLGLRMAEYAAKPPFEPALVLERRPDLDLRDVSFSRTVASGELLIQARLMQPGHQRVGFFKLGPSTFIALEDVTVECRSEKGCRYRVQGRKARLAARSLTFRGMALVRRGGDPARPGRKVEIDLESGRLREGG